MICIEYKCPHLIHEHDVSKLWNKTDFLRKVMCYLAEKKLQTLYTNNWLNGHILCRSVSFCLWRRKSKTVIENIQFDKVLWGEVLSNLILFFKSFGQNFLLGYNQILICTLSEK